MALRHPPHKQPVSSAQTSVRSNAPRVDQWPKATVTSAVWRPGTSNQGMKPAGAAAALALVSNSITPCAEQKRKRVSAFTIIRRRSTPVKSSCQAAGSLPYICCKKSPHSGPRKTVSTSAAKAKVRATVHDGSTPACTISTPWSHMAMCWWRSQSSRAPRSGACTTQSSVSSRLGRVTPAATASKCRSWLPSTHWAEWPSAIRRRSTWSDAGPRFTKSPSTYKVSRLGEKSTTSSKRCSGASQP